MDKNSDYDFITDYAVGVYNGASDLGKPSEFSSTITENNCFTYTFNSYNSNFDLTIPYF